MSSDPKILLFFPAEKVLSIFHHPNPSFSLSGHCHDQLSSADISIKAASLFFEFTYLYFPLFCLRHARYRSEKALHAEFYPPSWFSQDPHSFTYKNFGSFYWAWLQFV